MNKPCLRQGCRAGAAAIVLTLLAVLLLPDSGAPEADVSAPPDLAALVQPIAGTSRGGTFPGAATPFGMVQYSPNTDRPHGGGYSYGHPRTWGFATTHLSGPGCPAEGEVVSLPTTGPVKTVDVHRQETSFSHATELAAPGYYAVDLNSSHVHAELTATPRTGWARYTYPATSQANVIIEPGAGLRGTATARVHVVGNNTVEGSVTSWGYWNKCPDRGPNRYTLHFTMRFDRPFAAFGTGNGSRVRPNDRLARGADAAGYVTFNAAADARPVVSKVAISYVDVAGARRNMDDEDGDGYDFDAARNRARTGWNELLDRVQVSGGSQAQTQTFYTALYHALLYPSVFSDVDGRYVGFDDRVHTLPAGQAHYTAFSMWDTYRSAQQVIDLVAPERVPDMVHSLLDDQRQGGWLPKWPYAHYETNEMVGDPAANVIADAYLKGLVRPEDVGPVYAALLHNATNIPSGSPMEVRTGLDDYINRGFVPYGRGEFDNSASMSMEYALNDCAIGLMAQRLGFAADASYMLRRAKRYRDSIDRRARLARPRDTGGHFIRVSSRSGRGFKEGSAAQYTWLAQQDASGLARTLGGNRAALAQLDDFFQYPKVAADAGESRHVWHGPSRYNPHNETDLQAPYLYNYLGQPWKTQELVRGGEELFSTAPNGVPGGDDLGTMSGWYVLSALGIFPATGGDDHYALTSPLFDHAVVHMSGGDLVIDAPGASDEMRYVQAASLNGSRLATSAVSHSSLTGGAHLVFALGDAPNQSWASGAQAPAAACAANPPAADLRIHLEQQTATRRHSIIRATLHNAGDAPATGVGVVLRVPRGWSARHRSGRIVTLVPGHSAAITWFVRGGRVARLRAGVHWASAGARGGALRTFGFATARLR